MIKIEISNYGKKIPNYIKYDQNKNTKIWENIKKLKGESIVRKNIILYYHNGSKISKVDTAEENRIREVWNDEKRN